MAAHINVAVNLPKQGLKVARIDVSSNWSWIPREWLNPEWANAFSLAVSPHPTVNGPEAIERFLVTEGINLRWPVNCTESELSWGILCEKGFCFSTPVFVEMLEGR